MRQPAQLGNEPAVLQALGCDEHEQRISPRQHGSGLSRSQTAFGVDREDAVDAVRAQTLGLIVDQRDERVDHKRPAGHDEPGELVDQALSGPCREKYGAVPPLEDLHERIELPLTEVILGEQRAQQDPEGKLDCLVPRAQGRSLGTR